ncbi:MAG: hypothetical protein FJY92_00055 [Candidatus Hydrogenedentes bacterium]|nr:hypothetical protein [Candidatus Hydrogenedentota bacterium]
MVFRSVRWLEWALGLAAAPLLISYWFASLLPLLLFASDRAFRYGFRSTLLAFCAPALGLVLRRDLAWRRAIFQLPIRRARVRAVAWWMGVVAVPAFNVIACWTLLTMLRAWRQWPPFLFNWTAIVMCCICWTGSIAFLDSLGLGRRAMGFMSTLSMCAWVLCAPVARNDLSIGSVSYVVLLAAMTIASYMRRDRVLAGPLDAQRSMVRMPNAVAKLLDRVIRAPYVPILSLLLSVAAGLGWVLDAPPNGGRLMFSTAFSVIFSVFLTFVLRPGLAVYRTLPLSRWKLCVRIATPYAVLAVGFPVAILAASGDWSNAAPLGYGTAVTWAFGVSILGAAIGFACKRSYFGMTLWFLYFMAGPLTAASFMDTGAVLSLATGAVLCVIGLGALYAVLSHSDSAYRRGLFPQLDFEWTSNR